jgi:hypothetical protein
LIKFFHKKKKIKKSSKNFNNWFPQ